VKPGKPKRGKPAWTAKKPVARGAATDESAGTSGRPSGKAGTDKGTGGSQRAKLERELRAAIGEIDEKGLLFLLRQAQVLIHNARVESLQEEPGDSSGTGPIPAAKGRPETVSIEPGKGGVFVTLGNVRKVFAPDEMKRLVRICYGTETKSEALQRLFTVLVKERRDVLADAMIGSPDNPLIRGLFDVVRETYRLEDR
jgi:hypothetical protein